MKAARRISPRLLTDWLEQSGAEVCAFLETLDPEAPAMFGVAWAGEESSPNWFDIGREYTERWHHQQQIRDAVGAPPLTGRRYLYPVLDTFLRALPHAYRETSAPEGTTVGFHITGEAGGDWTLLRAADRWNLNWGTGDQPATTVGIDQDTAWRLLTEGLDGQTARGRATTSGDPQLAEPFFATLAVMA